MTLNCCKMSLGLEGSLSTAPPSAVVVVWVYCPLWVVFMVKTGRSISLLNSPKSALYKRFQQIRLDRNE